MAFLFANNMPFHFILWVSILLDVKDSIPKIGIAKSTTFDHFIRGYQTINLDDYSVNNLDHILVKK